MSPSDQTKPKVYVTRILPQVAWDELVKHAEVQIWDKESPPPYEVLLQNVRDKQGLLCLLTDVVDEGLMDAGPDLRVISQIAVGYDNIDIAAAAARGITVGNTPGVLTEATADFAFTLLMAGARRIGEGIDYVRDGRWHTWGLTLLLGQDVFGATLGIIGFGRIGQAVARRARGFDMKVLYYSRQRDREAEKALGAEYRPLDDLLAEADFVSLHVNLTSETRGMIASRELALMKPSAVLINTARGPVVEAGALYTALRESQIFYAALDVTDPEPIPPDDQLLSLDNVIVVPHMASATISSRTKMCLMAVDNLVAGLKGEPLPYQVN